MLTPHLDRRGKRRKVWVRRGRTGGRRRRNRCRKEGCNDVSLVSVSLYEFPMSQGENGTWEIRRRSESRMGGDGKYKSKME